MKAVDLQLLFELRNVLVSGRLMPIGLMRVFRVRGWVREGDTRLDVTAVDDEDRLEMCDSTMVSFHLTRVGMRELTNFDNALDNEIVRASLDHETRQMLDEEEDCGEAA